jgi:outer membrane receptor protein involved in Fe transport
MEVAGVREMQDIVKLTPGLIVNQGDNGANNIAIRGISSTAGASTTGVYIDDTPIQIRQLQYAAATVFPVVFDLQRVEVLRGPQGTLFGAGSEGGTVRFIQEQPNLTQYSGYARAEGANTTGHAASYELGASYGGPIIAEKIGFRVSAYYRQDGGYIDFGPALSFTVNHFNGEGLSSAATLVPNMAATQDNVNWTDSKVFHAVLTFAPTKELTITPSFYYQRQDRGYPNDTFYLAGSNPGTGFYFAPQFTPGPVGSTVCAAPCSTPGPLTQIHLPTGLFGNTTLSLGALNIQWNIGQFATLTSTTSYVYTAKVNLNDTTFYYAVDSINPGVLTYPLPGQFSPTLDQDDNKAAVQEFRLAGNTQHLNWLVGAFLSHNTQRSFEYEENNIWSGSNYFFGLYIPPDGPPFGPGFSSQQNAWGYPLLNDSGTYYAYASTAESQVAGFVQFDVKFTPVWTLTAGVRYSYNSLKYSLISLGDENNQNAPFGAPCPTGPVCPYGTGAFAPKFPTGVETTSARPTTPKVGINAQLTEHNLLYVSATKGFRMGGAELPLPADCSTDLINLGYVGANGKAYSPLTYSPDYVWSYEFGTKNTAFDNKLSVNASIYEIKWKNIQTAIPLPICGYQIIANTGSATVKGFDFDAQIIPMPGLQLRADIGYTHTSLDDGLYQPNGNAVYARGSAIPGSGAPWNIVVSGRYEVPINAQLQGYFYADDSWASQWPRTGLDDPRTFDFLPYYPPYPSFNITDLRLGVIRGGLDVSFFMNNVLNSNPLFLEPNQSFPGPYLWLAQTIRPRTLGVTAAYRF